MSDVLAKCTGTMQPIMPMNGETYSLVEMQHYVGGCIEKIDLGCGKVLIVDEEGKMKGKLLNGIATWWLLLSGMPGWIAGDAMLIESSHFE